MIEKAGNYAGFFIDMNNRLIILPGAVLWFLTILNGCKKPEACIQPSDTSVELGEPIAFTDCSENAANYKYDFGDGTTRTLEKNPSYSYEKPGTYTVSVEVSNKREKHSSQVSSVISVDGVTIGDFTVALWELYKTSELEDGSFSEEANIQTPGIGYRFASDSTYIFDGFSDPLALKFELLNDHQFQMDTVLYCVTRNYGDQLWFRTDAKGRYTLYQLKKSL